MSSEKTRVSIGGVTGCVHKHAQAGSSPREWDACESHGQTVGCALVRSQLARILLSRPFSGSERMRRFLQFTVEAALAGNCAELKEYVLGIEIFDRAAETFDPRIDPIVRVEARRLRSKLKEYYEGQGSRDTIVIDLPTGCYVPRFRHRAGSGRDSDVARASATRALPPPPDCNILVLPFTNLSSDVDTEHFSDGLTQELIHVLTQAGGFQVVAGNAALKFKDGQDDIPNIGRQFNVDGVLVGSVRRSVDRLRVMARLIETTSGYYVWSETYGRHIDDLLASQEAISHAIVATCRSRVVNASSAIPNVPLNLECYTPKLHN